VIVGVTVVEVRDSAKPLVKHINVVVVEETGVHSVDEESSKMIVTGETERSLGRYVPVNVKLSPPSTLRA